MHSCILHILIHQFYMYANISLYIYVCISIYIHTFFKCL